MDKKDYGWGNALCHISPFQRGGCPDSPGKTENPGAIVIDSGHGGIDPGVVGIDGLEEKGINLKIAGFLGEYLEAEGYEVVLQERMIQDCMMRTAGIKRIRT